MDFASDIRTALADQIGRERSELWFDDTQFEQDGSQLRVLGKSQFLLDRIKRDFQDSIRRAAIAIGMIEPEISFAVGVDTNAQNIGQPREEDASSTKPATIADRTKSGDAVDTKPSHGPTAAAEPATSKRRRMLASSQPARKTRFRKFDSFVEGPCNRLARKSAEMVVSQPGEISPLVVHGPTGVGKTHLMESIWCLARSRRQRARVVYLSAEQFTTYFVDALKGNGLPNFRRKYREADLLIIDDIQFFAGKQATLVELAYTIDELARDNRQLILTADRPPSQLSGVLGRDISNRLLGGLVCAMKPISQETMESISMQWAADKQIALDKELHATIASRMQGDARQLSGVLNRLRAASLALNEPITMRMANEVMYELMPAQTRIVRMQDVRKSVCEVFGVESDVLQRPSRSRAVSQPRMVAMYLARKLTSAGLHEISQFFGRRSHSSAVSASNKVDQWVARGEQVDINGQACDIRDVLSQIESRLRAG